MGEIVKMKIYKKSKKFKFLVGVGFFGVWLWFLNSKKCEKSVVDLTVFLQGECGIFVYRGCNRVLHPAWLMVLSLFWVVVFGVGGGLVICDRHVLHFTPQLTVFLWGVGLCFVFLGGFWGFFVLKVLGGGCFFGFLKVFEVCVGVVVAWSRQFLGFCVCIIFWGGG